MGSKTKQGEPALQPDGEGHPTSSHGCSGKHPGTYEGRAWTDPGGSGHRECVPQCASRRRQEVYGGNGGYGKPSASSHHLRCVGVRVEELPDGVGALRSVLRKSLGGDFRGVQVPNLRGWSSPSDSRRGRPSPGVASQNPGLHEDVGVPIETIEGPCRPRGKMGGSNHQRGQHGEDGESLDTRRQAAEAADATKRFSESPGGRLKSPQIVRRIHGVCSRPSPSVTAILGPALGGAREVCHEWRRVWGQEFSDRRKVGSHQAHRSELDVDQGAAGRWTWAHGANFLCRPWRWREGDHHRRVPVGNRRCPLPERLPDQVVLLASDQGTLGEVSCRCWRSSTQHFVGSGGSSGWTKAVASKGEQASGGESEIRQHRSSANPAQADIAQRMPWAQ